MSSDPSYPQDRPSGPPTEPVPTAPEYARPPQEAYEAPPTAAYPQYQPPQPPQYQQPQYQQPYAAAPDGRVTFQPPGPMVEHPQAVLAFVLGLLSVLGLLITGPFGWWYGRRVVREIDQDPRQFSNRGLAMTGMVLGIIGTVFLLLIVALVVVGIVVAVAMSGTSTR